MRLMIAALAGLTIFWSIPASAQDAFLPSETVSRPVLVKSAKPAYTSATMKARIQGQVALQVDVRPDGTVGTVALVKSLHAELDEEAVKAARQFVYTPGMKDGTPVTVRIDLTIAFSMR